MKKLITATATVAFALSVCAFAEDGNGGGNGDTLQMGSNQNTAYQRFGVGVGGAVTQTTGQGAAGSSEAQLSYRRFSPGTSGDDGSPMHVVEINAHYNAIGAANGKPTTGVTGHALFMVGYTPMKDGTNGCDIYAGGVGELDGGAYMNRNGSNNVDGGVSLETGLFCQVAKSFAVTVSPTVRAGGAANYDGAGNTLAQTGAIAMGGRARVVFNGQAYVSAEYLNSPQIDNSQVGNAVKFTASAPLGDKWNLEADVKETNYGTSGNSKSFNDMSAGLSVIRAF